jgi:hypothetical protein
MTCPHDLFPAKSHDSPLFGLQLFRRTFPAAALQCRKLAMHRKKIHVAGGLPNDKHWKTYSRQLPKGS